MKILKKSNNKFYFFQLERNLRLKKYDHGKSYCAQLPASRQHRGHRSFPQAKNRCLQFSGIPSLIKIPGKIFLASRRSSHGNPAYPARTSRSLFAAYRPAAKARAGSIIIKWQDALQDKATQVQWNCNRIVIKL